MHRLISIVFIVGALVLSACGDGDETTVTEPPAADTTAETTGADTTSGGTLTDVAGAGPESPLSPQSIGSAHVGDDPDSVEAAIGPPDEKRRVPGCELAGDRQPKDSWVWHLDQGGVILEFDPEEGLTSYRTTSPELETRSGSRVGDSFDSVRGAEGDLKPLDLGAPSTRQDGFWYVGQDLDSTLLFSFAGGRVDSISGGSIEICE